MRNIVNNILLGVLAAILGVIFSLAGTAVHAYFIGPVPAGLIIALIASAAILLALRLLMVTRWYSLICFAVMMIVVYILAQPTANGSVLISNKFEDFAWIYGLVIIGLIIQVFPTLKLSQAEQEPESNAVSFR